MKKTERAVRGFIEGAKTRNPKRMRSVRRAFTAFSRELEDPRQLSTAHLNFSWHQAMRQIARLDSIPKRSQLSFQRFYVRFGHYIRLETADDLALVDALRVLLPPYDRHRLRIAHTNRRSAESKRRHDGRRSYFSADSAISRGL